MAVIRRIEAQRSFDIGGIPSTQLDDGVGQGLRAVGGAMHDAANTMHAMEMRRIQASQDMTAYEEDQRRQRWENENAGEFLRLKGEMPETGEGFAATASKLFTDRSLEFLESVPDWLRPKVNEIVATSREKWVSQATATELDQRRQYVAGTIDQRRGELQSQIFDDPALFEDAVSDMERQIDLAPGMSPAEKEVMKKSAKDSFLTAKASRYVRDDPGRITGGGDAVDQFVDRIIGVESGGRADAKNSNSSATGAGQFISSTWLGMVRKYRPDLMDGRTNAEVLALRNNYGLSREMTRLYAQENAAFLANQGIQQTPGSIYLAHFLGPRGAAQVLKANPDASIESIVGSDAVKANKFLSGKTAGWTANWAAKKMGGEAADIFTSSEFEGMGFDDRLKFYDQALASQQRQFQAMNSQQATLKAAEYDDLTLGIRLGSVSSEQEILNAIHIDNGQRATLIDQLRSRKGDQMKIGEGLAALNAGNFRADPFSSDSRKIVDGMYGALEQAVPADDLQIVTENLISQSGIVPQRVHNAIRAGLESTVPSEVETAAQQAARIAQISPAILGRREGGSEVQKKADLFDTLTRSMGYSEAEAARRIAEQNDPEKARQRAALLSSEPVKKMLKDIDEGDITKAFSTMFSMGWTLGENEAQKAAMVSEYKSILQETILDANGDQTAAKDLANKRFERIYGASDLTLANAGWGNVITRLPPEKVYEPMPDGSFDYINDQLREALSGEGVKFDDIRLSSYDVTDLDHQNGEPPRYQVWYKNDGEWQLFHLPFYADRSAALDAYSAEQSRLLEERREQMEQNRQDELTRFPEGRDGPERFSNDDLYYGAARADSPMGRSIRQRREKSRQTREAVAPLIEQDALDRQRQEALDPNIQRERMLDEYLNGPLMPGGR